MDLAAEKTELERWRERLNATGLPVFARTVREVSTVATSAASSAADLSAVVGRDASMSAKIIQIANSPLFNLQNRSINTIDEAVVLVGFDAIRELAISVCVLEELHKEHQHERCATLMARAFHAAAHSKFVSQASGSDGGEDVFVGALLKDVGPMAFWSRGGPPADALHAAISKSGHQQDTAQLEQDCLGFNLEELSIALAEDWRLGGLLIEVLKGRSELPGVASVLKGYSLAVQIETYGLQADEVQSSIRALAKQLGKPTEQVIQAVEDNFTAAEDLVRHLGISVVAAPVDQVPHPESDEARQADAPTSDDIMRVLKKIALAMEEGLSRDQLMQQVVDSVHQHLHYSAAAFALFTPDRTKLLVKYESGTAMFKDKVLEPGQLSLDVTGGETGAVNVQQQGQHIQHSVCVRINNKPVGVLFGNVVASSGDDNSYVTAFRQMAQQLTLILTTSH